MSRSAGSHKGEPGSSHECNIRRINTMMRRGDVKRKTSESREFGSLPALTSLGRHGAPNQAWGEDRITHHTQILVVFEALDFSFATGSLSSQVQESALYELYQGL